MQMKNKAVVLDLLTQIRSDIECMKDWLPTANCYEDGEMPSEDACATLAVCACSIREAVMAALGFVRGEDGGEDE